MSTSLRLQLFVLLSFFIIECISTSEPTSDPTHSPIISNDEVKDGSVDKNAEYYLKKYLYIWLCIGVLMICCIGYLFVFCVEFKNKPKQITNISQQNNKSYMNTTENLNNADLDDQNVVLTKHGMNEQFNMDELVPSDNIQSNETDQQMKELKVGSNDSRLTALSTVSKESIRYSAYDQTASIVKNQSSRKLLIEPSKQRGSIYCIHIVYICVIFYIYVYRI